jgi:hypothetical protein
MSTILHGVTSQNIIQHLAGKCEGKGCSGGDEAHGRIILKRSLKKQGVGGSGFDLTSSQIYVYISQTILPSGYRTDIDDRGLYLLGYNVV